MQGRWAREAGREQETAVESGGEVVPNQEEKSNRTLGLQRERWADGAVGEKEALRVTQEQSRA